MPQGGSSAPIRWHQRPVYIEEDERRERYEARLALDYCRQQGNPHLATKD